MRAGADFGPEGAGFYGHLLPSQVPVQDDDDLVGLTLYYSEHSVLINLDGERFVDETEGDHLTTLSLLQQREARGLLISDARVREEWMMRPYVANAVAVDKFDLAYRRGGRCAVADSIDDLRYLPEEWGYDGARVRDAMEQFDAQCALGNLNPARRRDAAPINNPPFYVIEAVPAISYTFSGLRIDADARVLDSSGRPIPGLLAAGADAGGVFDQAYSGGLATALVFGLTASRTASPHR